jgi:hypothetical protein
MHTIKFILKKIKAKPIPVVLTILSIVVSPLIPTVLNSFVKWLELDAIANISILLIIVMVTLIIIISEIFYLFSFAKELLNPFDIYPYDEETNTCVDKKTGKRYCPTGMTDNKRHPVRKEFGIWLCSNKNCKNSIPPPISKQW